jgi:hypothetical protein
MEQQFSDKEAEEILRMAAEKFAAAESKQHTSIGRKDIEEIAAEIGVPPEYVSEAISVVSTASAEPLAQVSPRDRWHPVPGSPKRRQWIREVPGVFNDECRPQAIHYLNSLHDSKGRFAFTKDLTEWASAMDGPMTTCTFRNVKGHVQVHFTEPVPPTFDQRPWIAMLVLAAVYMVVALYMFEPQAAIPPLMMLGIGWSNYQRARDIYKLDTKYRCAIMDRLECIIRRENDPAKA